MGYLPDSTPQIVFGQAIPRATEVEEQIYPKRTIYRRSLNVQPAVERRLGSRRPGASKRPLLCDGSMQISLGRDEKFIAAKDPGG